MYIITSRHSIRMFKIFIRIVMFKKTGVLKFQRVRYVFDRDNISVVMNCYFRSPRQKKYKKF